MKDRHVVPAILEPHRRVRYLKIIALFKIAKGVLLLMLGCSLLFINARGTWLDNISDWADREILLGHSRGITFFLHKLEEVVSGGHLRATAFLAFFYCIILFTEGTGVYMQKRWAEFLMIFATAALIPIEVRHLWHRPSLAALIILVANVFIVWFLYLVLKREKPVHVAKQPAELIGTR
jgi:uncharacterized membrane protein (DUF2068 family)